MREPDGRRGAALIIVLSVLLILAMVATAFVTLQGIEQCVSRNYVDGVRARLLAQAGIDYALVRIREDLQTGGLTSSAAVRPMTYWGDIVDELGGASPNEAIPLEAAANPSYAIDALGVNSSGYNPSLTTNPTPLQLLVNGKPVGISMTMDSGTYGAHSDVVSLRVADLQGRIHINDGINESVPYRPVTENLRRILNVLGSLPTVQEPGLGNVIVDNRPAGGYRATSEILPLLGGNLPRYGKVRRFVTIYSWVDKQVALPVPLSQSMLSSYPVGTQYYRGSPPIYRAGRGLDYKGNPVSVPLKFCPPASHTDPATRVWGLDELRPQWIQLAERAPVNVNAAPREVLIALIADLQGFFLMEQRRRFGDESKYPWGGIGGLGLYHWMITYYTYSPEKYRYRSWWTIWNPDNYEVDEADDLGRLYVTHPFATNGGTVTSNTVLAEAVADEIVACRKKVASSIFNYTTAWFGGPFRTWRQFHAFCDNLVKIGVLKDPRPIFRDYPPTGNDPWGWHASPVVSTVQQRFAAQAMADVLKANFNPNLHLNELNPDRNLHLLVDKTDLVVNSTEFCFAPMGYYEIESLGRVLRPTGADSFTSSNQVAAEKKCVTVVRVFDMLRQTTQRDFYPGTFTPRKGWQKSNNNLSVETGPEPDNGTGPQECDFDGYVALPSVGGNGATHPKGTLATTPAAPNSTEGMKASLHSHFAGDDRLHYHADGSNYGANLTRVQLGNAEAVDNFKDPAAAAAGPYVPTAGAHRLSRTFRITPGDPLPTLNPTTDLDLRVDGIYSERHSGLAYWVSPTVLPPETVTKWGYSASAQNGVAAYWIKPSFVPELSGKSRKFFDTSLGAAKIWWGESVHEFAHYFFPGHDAPPYKPPVNEPSFTYYINGVAPMSFMFGMNWGGTSTNSLNHETHVHSAPVKSVVRNNDWVHVVLRWRRGTSWWAAWGYPFFVTDVAIYVNGKLEGSSTIRSLGHAAYSDVIPGHPVKWWYFNADGSNNSIRLGAPSRLMLDPTKGYNRGWNPYVPQTCPTVTLSNVNANYIQNWSADATLDEFYFWGTSSAGVNGALQSALSLWTMGRYYVPQADDGEFESANLSFLPSAPRGLAPPSPVLSGSSSTTITTTPPPEVTILGAAWTLVPEDHDPATGAPILRDRNPGAPTLPIQIDFGFRENGNAISPVVHDDGFSGVSNLSGGPLRVQANEPVRYAAKFRLQGAGLSTILLTTPVLDDVSIYFTRGIEFLSYAIE